MIKNLTKYITTMIITILVFIAQGCSTMQPSLNKTEAISIQIITNEKINPDINGRPSPLLIYIYSVSDSEYFLIQNYFGITEDTDIKNNLSSTLIDNFTVNPESQITRKYTFSKEEKYIGVIAGFRDINNSLWKIVLDKKELKLNFISKIFMKNKHLQIQINDKQITYKSN